MGRSSLPVVTAAEGRDETPQQRADRNFTELLQELRVVETGVQILFAFLLTLPFSSRFATILPRDRVAYVITLLASAAAAVLLIAPVSYHRLVFRRNRKQELVQTASRLAQAGVACLSVAITGAVFVVMDVVTGLLGACVAAAAIAVACIALWYMLPLRRRSEPPAHP
jgi:O-antigen/teichoic acid export membrane protein